ncbi:MAG: glycosyltransferase family 2 protein [Microgenomates group bacterium]
MKENKISTIIIAKNEEEKIGECLESLSWADEVIVVDSGSTDKTVEIARKKKAKVIRYTKGGFSDWRNKGAKEAKGDWLLYVDADERVTPLLRKEILTLIKNSPDKSLYAIPRRNIILGKEMKHGGWWPDYVKRLMKKSNFKKWEGELHENPVVDGKLGHLKEPLTHLKHDNLGEMVEKTNEWSQIEARLLFDADHPKMTWWRFFRIMATELWHRLIKLKGFLDGTKGVIYAIYQMWSKFVTYAKLWEMQLNVQKQNVKS